MTSAELTDDDPDDIGGDCPTYIRLCRCRRETADSLGLPREIRHAWDDLLCAADFRTGIVDSITWEGTAALLDCSIPTAKKWLRALANLDLILFHFPQGHAGFIAVVSYLDVVRVVPTQAAQIDAKLRAATERAAARSVAKSRKGASRALAPHGDAEKLRSDDESFRIGDPDWFLSQIAERTGETPDSPALDSGHGLFSSPMGEGGQSRGTTSRREHEATRVSRADRWCPLLRDPCLAASAIRVKVRRCGRPVGAGSIAEQPRLDLGFSDGY